MEYLDDEVFEISIDFKPGEGDAARVFRTMSELIESIQSLDKHLISTMSISLDAKLILDDIERGSLKAKLRDLIEGIPDEALKESEWKKVIGHFLIKAKYLILVWLSERDEIKDRGEVRNLEQDLLQLAEETDIKTLPAYAPIPADRLLSDINSVQESLSNLGENDSASYHFGGHEVKFNRKLQISNEIVRDVLTKEIIRTAGTKVVKVKKPDYLGQSMWAFQYEGHGIEAKIVDEEWLVKFQTRTVDVKPGDSLKVKLLEEISYGYEGEIVHRHYEIEKVLDVIRPVSQRDIDF